MKFAKMLPLTIVLAAFVLSMLPAVGQAQSIKIGFVKDERIKTEYDAWQRAQEDWELENKVWEEEATAMEQELQELQEEFEKQKLILSEEKRREKELVIQTKMESLDDFTRKIYGPGGSAERKYEQLISPLLDDITRAIEAVAIEEDFDVVFTMQSGLGYIKEQYDITDKVLQKLDEIE
jgi:outer membrane protein